MGEHSGQPRVGTPILELHHITKAFGDNVANDDISLTIRSGEVHAIVGENGAGKTTLMTMIAGTARPDSGWIVVDGERVSIDSPKRADALGIGMVHQHFKLVPSLSVASNIFLGRERTNSLGALDNKAMERRVGELSQQFGLHIDPAELVQTLSVGERQRVEVIKALSHDTRLLILDEPTAVLTPAEVDELFVVIRDLAKQGCAVLFISHKLGEVLSIADQVTVIRDGAVVGSRPAATLSETSIASMMVGRDVLLRIEHTPGSPSEEVLHVDGLFAVDGRGAVAVRNLSLSVRAGEIVGIAGVEGNGQSELAAAIAGMAAVQRGTITLGGADVTDSSVHDRRAAGMAYIPEDRHDEGTAPNLNVAENVAATHLRPPLTRSGFLQRRELNAFGERLIDDFDVRGAQPDTVIETLSGGNMQKVIIAREFSAEPSLLMVAQPTRGVDVGAMEFVHRSIVAARDNGAAVLLISADLNEVMSLSDRLLVLYRGEVIAEFAHDDVNEIAVGLAMAGTPPTAENLAAAEAEHAKIVQKIQEDLPSDVPAAVESPPDLPAAERTDDVSGGRGASKLGEVLAGASGPLIAVAFALLVGGLIVFATGHNPLTAYWELFASPWRSGFGVASLLAAVVPLLILSGAVIISFRAGLFNIGGEGQMYLGAFAGALVGSSVTGLPGWMVTVLLLVIGAAAGAMWGLIPGALYGYWKVDIIVTTLMMSTIAMKITEYMVTGPVQDPTAGIAGTRPLAPGVRLPTFNAVLGLGPDLIIAIVVTVALGLVLTRSVWGLWVRELGQHNRFAEYTGVSQAKMSMQVMAVAGAASGFAGALFVVGPSGGRFLQNFSPGFGFLGITVALLGRLNPWGAIVASLFYANLIAGTTGLQNAGLPYPVVNVIQGLIIIFITAQFTWSRWKKRSASADSPDDRSAPEPVSESEIVNGAVS